MWALLLVTSTALLFLLPAMAALREWHSAGDAKPLEIIQAHAGDIRHFAERFKSIVEREIEDTRSKADVAGAEGYYLVDQGEVFDLDECEEKDRVVRRILIAEGLLVLPDRCSYEREVYGKDKVVTGIGNRLCAVLAEGDLDIECGTVVSRWAHARSIHIGPGCVILGRLSAICDIAMEPGCQFTRVNAPTVRFAPIAAVGDEADRSLAPVQKHKVVVKRSAFGLADNRWISDSDLILSDESVFQGDLVVRGSLVIGRASEIVGRIKVYGSTRLEHGVKIVGSLVSVGPVAIGVHCSLLGPVVSEREIEIESRTTIGKRDRPTTVTAPSIRVASDVVVHGTVWARQRATVGDREAQT